MYNLNKVTEVSIMQINMVQTKEITLDSDLRELRRGGSTFLYMSVYIIYIHLLCINLVGNCQYFFFYRYRVVESHVSFCFKWSQDILREQLKLILVLCQYSYS